MAAITKPQMAVCSHCMVCVGNDCHLYRMMDLPSKKEAAVLSHRGVEESSVVQTIVNKVKVEGGYKSVPEVPEKPMTFEQALDKKPTIPTTYKNMTYADQGRIEFILKTYGVDIFQEDLQQGYLSDIEEEMLNTGTCMCCGGKVVTFPIFSESERIHMCTDFRKCGVTTRVKI